MARTWAENYRSAIRPIGARRLENSEDYSEFVKAGVPSIFFAIGGLDLALLAKAKAEKKAAPVNHSPDFAPVPEPTIKRGAETLTLAALTALTAR